jgi:hypothetical protein
MPAKSPATSAANGLLFLSGGWAWECVATMLDVSRGRERCSLQTPARHCIRHPVCTYKPVLSI